ncbi:hypothetical protein [Carnobacterium sp.]|uniref:hypothetical protein n=1 Tax=Carnobacterium sp. TaxID=48221 RepID=UPI00388F6AA9
MKKFIKKNIIALVALILSIISFGFTVVQFNYDIRKDKNFEEENISIINKSVSYNHVGEYKKFIDGSGLINGVVYDITISNNSKQKASFLNYDFFLNNANHTEYSNIVENITIGNAPLSFPFMLDAGEAVTISINVNTVIPKDINVLLETHFNYDTHITFDELNEYLYSKNFDFYGNKIDVRTYENEERLVEITNPKFPEYYFQLTTIKNNTFSQIITR